MEAGYHFGGYLTPVDHYADGAVYALFMSKSYALFSFMFGAGLGFQMQSAARKGVAFGPRYSRRIIGLLILGSLHFVFFFIGDILITYAILGALLYRFRHTAPKKLMIVGIILIAIQALIYGLITAAIWLGTTFAPDEMPTTEAMMMEANLEVAAYQAETFWAVAQYRFSQFYIAPLVALIQGFSVLGYFLIGLAAVKVGVINNPSAAIWKKLRHYALPIGLAGNIYAAWLMSTAQNGFTDVRFFTSMTIVGIFAPLLAFGYAGLIAAYADGPVTPIKRFLARAGSATLTAYLMQSVILSYIFSGYGLGLYAQLGAATCIAIALATGLFTLLFSSVWRARFSRGPMEYLLRSWTYLGRS